MKNKQSIEISPQQLINHLSSINEKLLDDDCETARALIKELTQHIEYINTIQNKKEACWEGFEEMEPSDPEYYI